MNTEEYLQKKRLLLQIRSEAAPDRGTRHELKKQLRAVNRILDYFDRLDGRHTCNNMAPMERK